MHKGKVIIAGAGPGDPELITLKAARYLAMADVILTDRLVSKDIIAAHASVFAEVILVGKDGCKNGMSVTQEEINRLIVMYAKQGNTVVRLKGGDVAFFSNVLDELQTLAQNNIAYEIIPGITAASGASAFAGMPLTARGHSRGVRFMTWSAGNYKQEDNVDWKELAHTKDTLVFYMAGANWKELAAHFIENQVDENKKIAIIEQATTPYQKVHIYPFNNIDKITNNKFVSPSLVVIGSVVSLHQQFAWKKNATLSGNYFPDATRTAITNDTTIKQTA